MALRVQVVQQELAQLLKNCLLQQHHILLTEVMKERKIKTTIYPNALKVIKKKEAIIQDKTLHASYQGNPLYQATK